LRNRTPLVQQTINRGSRGQTVNVAVIQRFKANTPALQHKTFGCHDFNYAMSPAQPQGTNTQSD
jgi:hypothetical protein